MGMVGAQGRVAGSPTVAGALPGRWLAAAAGLACAQGWLPVLGLVWECYRGGADVARIAGPMWFGAAVGLLAAFGGRLAAGRRGAGLLRRPAVGLTLALVGLMLLVATRAAGTFTVFPAASLWRAVAALGSLLGAAGGGVIACAWLDACDSWAGRGAGPGAAGPDPAPDALGRRVLSGVLSALVLALLCAAFCAMGSGVWPPFAAGVLMAVSYALLEAAAPGAGTGPVPTVGAPGVSAPDDAGGGRAGGARGRVCLRPLAAGALLAGTAALMMGQFLGCKNGVASPYTGAFGVLGVGVALAMLLVLRRLRGGWDPFVACWAVAALFVVAYYPMNAGSAFSLRFAVSMTVLAAFAAAAVLPGALAAFAAWEGAPASRAQLSFACGAVAASAVAGPAGYAAAFTSYEGTFVLVSAVSSMVVVLVALTAVLYAPLRLGRGAPGEAGRAPGGGGRGGEGAPLQRMAYTVAADIPDMPAMPAAPAGEADVDAACARVAARYGLTARECEVLGVLARGYDVARVQEELGISEGTALTHKRHIYQKLDVHTRSELLDLVRSFPEGPSAVG